VFDLVILDIMGVDGFILLPLASRKKVPTVMLTANALSVQDTIKSVLVLDPLGSERSAGVRE
jgi:hypothetical protein